MTKEEFIDGIETIYVAKDTYLIFKPVTFGRRMNASLEEIKSNLLAITIGKDVTYIYGGSVVKLPYGATNQQLADLYFEDVSEEAINKVLNLFEAYEKINPDKAEVRIASMIFRAENFYKKLADRDEAKAYLANMNLNWAEFCAQEEQIAGEFAAFENIISNVKENLNG